MTCRVSFPVCCRQMERQGLYLVAGLPMMLAVEAQFENSLLNCRPSVVAAALLYAERRQRGAVPFWPSMLAKMTGYEDLTQPELACAVKSAQKLCRKGQYMQLYKAQSAQLAAQLSGMTAPQQQMMLSATPSLQLSSASAAAVLEQQVLEQQEAVRRITGMQADAVVAPPQLGRVPPVSIAPSTLALQPSLSGPLSARALSASSSSSSTLGMGVVGAVAGSGGVPPAGPGMLNMRGAGVVVQQSQLDLALLAQLQLQEQHRQQQQLHEQHRQQQQQANSLAALSAAGLLGGNTLQLGAGNLAAVSLQTPLQGSMFAVGNAAGAGCFVGGGDAGRVPSFNAGMSPFALGLQTPILQQQQQQQLEHRDASGLENRALTLSALGLHGGSDGQINTATLEAALRQQR